MRRSIPVQRAIALRAQGMSWRAVADRLSSISGRARFQGASVAAAVKQYKRQEAARG